VLKICRFGRDIKCWPFNCLVKFTAVSGLQEKFGIFHVLRFCDPLLWMRIKSSSWRCSRVVAECDCAMAFLHRTRLWTSSSATLVARVSSLIRSIQRFFGRPRGRWPTGSTFDWVLIASHNVAVPSLAGFTHLRLDVRNVQHAPHVGVDSTDQAEWDPGSSGPSETQVPVEHAHLHRPRRAPLDAPPYSRFCIWGASASSGRWVRWGFIVDSKYCGWTVLWVPGRLGPRKASGPRLARRPVPEPCVFHFQKGLR